MSNLNSVKYKKIIKFLISGFLAAGMEYGVFLILFQLLSLEVLLSNSVSFLCGLIVSFSLNRAWVFNSRENGKKQFAAYFTLALVNLAISNVLVWAMVHQLYVSAFVAKFLCMGLIATWNYVIFGKLIFRKNPEL
jgi:putative flippase GtrA